MQLHYSSALICVNKYNTKFKWKVFGWFMNGVIIVSHQVTERTDSCSNTLVFSADKQQSLNPVIPAYRIRCIGITCP